jgi:predicted dehydrogenase
MKLAILGADPTTLALAREAADRADFEITCVCELEQAFDPTAAELQRAAARSARRLETWEDLLDRQLVDAVIVARGPDEDRRTDQLRKLAQAGMPVLMSPRVVSSMLLLYELDMIRRENQAIAVPALVERLHPAIAELANIIRAADESVIGRVEQVAIERQLADRSKSAVLDHFCCDVDLLRKLCGELAQLGAMGTAGDELAYGNLGVNMTGPSGLLARWSVGPVEHSQTGGARLILTGSRGKATLEMPNDGRPWSLTIPGETTPRNFSDWNSARVALDQFERATHGETAEPDLLDAARATELTETIARSLRRRRTIDLHFEEHSEQNTFKGKMAAGGCLLLMLGLGLVMVAAIAEQANVPLVGLWPKLLAVVFGLFLAMQLLLLVFRRKPPE